MKKAGAYLLPFREEEKAAAAKARADAGLPPIEAKGRGTIVMSTVKGDVHDIGKVSVRLTLTLTLTLTVTVTLTLALTLSLLLPR